MAEKPIPAPLPADLPENWTAGQTVSPDGTSVGLSEKHGYNYLMQMVNRAQQGVNTLNEEMAEVGGKRTCRFTVGTSAAGWTEADCDYLCDGTDDQMEINQALLGLAGTGGEVVLLAGVYHLSAGITLLQQTTLRGNGLSTKLIRENGASGGTMNCMILMQLDSFLSDLVYDGGRHAGAEDYEIYVSGGKGVRNVRFTGIGGGIIYINGTGNNDRYCEIALCSFISGSPCIYGKSGLYLLVENNYTVPPASVLIETAPTGNMHVYIRGNAGNVSCGDMILDGLSNSGGSIIEGNRISSLEIRNTRNAALSSGGNLVVGNNFRPNSGRTAIILGAHTSGNFVTGNMLFNNADKTNYGIENNGTNNIIRFNSNDRDDGGSSPTTVSQAVPDLSVSESGLITATSVQAAGTVAAGTRSATHQISQADDQDLAPENIREGVTIFGVEGTLKTGGGTAAVTSFNGRSGAVEPQSGDYTAAMVGARAETWTPTAADVGAPTMEEVNAAITAAITGAIKEAY